MIILSLFWGIFTIGSDSLIYLALTSLEESIVGILILDYDFKYWLLYFELCA